MIKRLKAGRVAYNLVGAYYQFYFRLSNRKAEMPIIVYQMGKVGSQSIIKTLETLNLSRPIYHVHRITLDGLEYIEERAENMGRLYPGKNYWSGQYLRQKLKNRSSVDSWDIISMIRDPVARNLSAFFHGLNYWYPEAQEEYDQLDDQVLFTNIRQVFLNKFPHDRPITWFNSEIRSIFGIDIFSGHFPKEKRYKIYDGEQDRLLLIRLEDFNRCYREAMHEFLRIEFEKFTLVKANIATQKWYGLLYVDFLNWLVLPSDYLKKLYGSRLIQHFYSREEIKQFRQKWSRRIE